SGRSIRGRVRGREQRAGNGDLVRAGRGLCGDLERRPQRGFALRARARPPVVGNAATCPTWGDFWIQEAFAVFMTAAYKERRWGRATYEHERDMNRARYEAFRASGGDGALALGPDARSGQLARKLVYGKGPRVLYALRDEIGEQAFWSAVRAF